MKQLSAISIFAFAAALGAPATAYAQDSDAEALRAELQQLRAQLSQLNAKVETLEGDLDAVRAEASNASAGVVEVRAIAVEANGAKPANKVSWKGSPQLKGKGGWSFQPFGRMQFDAGTVSAPSATGGDSGFGNEVRRVRIGAKGDMPGGFGYKLEVDFADGAEVTDAILTYKDGGLKVAVGQHNNFQSLEELTSSRFISLMERAAFTDAFGFERRVGVSAQYHEGDVLVQGGVFTDNMDDLSNKNWSTDGRVVFSPKSGSTQLHFGGSLHYAELGGDKPTVRYRQRPQVHFTSTRFVNTGKFSAQSEMGYGLEAAVINGPFHAVGEAFWQNVNRPSGFADPTFFGGYFEAGVFLTPGDTRGYKGGKFDRVKPASPVGEGGMGAVQLVGRYDYLDLNDAGITGGKQDAFGLGLIWTPTDYTRFMLNYEHLNYSDAAIPAANNDRSYGADVFAARAQIDF